MSSVERPIISNLRRSNLERILDVVAFLGLSAIWGITVYYYSKLPTIVPHHFNAAGNPDAWGNKSSALILPITYLAIFAALTVLARFPHCLNYPWPITQSNARNQYALARQLLSAEKACGMGIFLYISWARIETALGGRQGLGSWFSLVSLLLTLSILAIYAFRAARNQ